MVILFGKRTNPARVTRRILIQVHEIPIKIGDSAANKTPNGVPNGNEFSLGWSRHCGGSAFRLGSCFNFIPRWTLFE